MKWLLLLAILTVGSLHFFSPHTSVPEYADMRLGSVDTSEAEYLGGGLIIRQPLMPKEWHSSTILNVFWRWLVFSRRQDSAVQAAFFANDMGIFRPFDGFSLRVSTRDLTSWELVQDKSLWMKWLDRLSQEQRGEFDSGNKLCLRQGLNADFCLIGTEDQIRIQNRMDLDSNLPSRECRLSGASDELSLSCSQTKASLSGFTNEKPFCVECSSYLTLNWVHLPKSQSLMDLYQGSNQKALQRILLSLTRVSGVVYKRVSGSFALKFRLAFQEPSDSARILTELSGYLIENQHPYELLGQKLVIPLPLNFGHLTVKRERVEILVEFGNPGDVTLPVSGAGSSFAIWDLLEFLPLMRSRIEGSSHNFVKSMQETCQKNREEHSRFCPLGPALIQGGCPLHGSQAHFAIQELLYGEVLSVLPALLKADFEFVGEVDSAFRSRIRWR